MIAVRAVWRALRPLSVQRRRAFGATEVHVEAVWLADALDDLVEDDQIVLSVRAVQQALVKRTRLPTPGAELVDVDAPLHARLARLLADLLCR